jgi:hypothetical protein
MLSDIGGENSLILDVGYDFIIACISWKDLNIGYPHVGGTLK